MRLGRRYGYRAKRPCREKLSGKFSAGWQKYPPIAGPMIVPMLHTKGMIAYARAISLSAVKPALQGDDAYARARVP